jgi:hypothetical protein
VNLGHIIATSAASDVAGAARCCSAMRYQLI